MVTTGLGTSAVTTSNASIKSMRSINENGYNGIGYIKRLELLPRSVVDEIEATRAHLLKKMFNLPRSTATNIKLVLFDLWPANFVAISQRVTFARKMTDHDLVFVRDAFTFDRTVLLRAKEGWHYETFLLFQSMFQSERISDFTINRISARLTPISRALTQFLFHLVQATDEATLAPLPTFPNGRNHGFVPRTTRLCLKDVCGVHSSDLFLRTSLSFLR
jgi:hypothetical protein